MEKVEYNMVAANISCSCSKLDFRGEEKIYGVGLEDKKKDPNLISANGSCVKLLTHQYMSVMKGFKENEEGWALFCFQIFR